MAQLQSKEQEYKLPSSTSRERLKKLVETSAGGSVVFSDDPVKDHSLIIRALQKQGATIAQAESLIKHEKRVVVSTQPSQNGGACIVVIPQRTEFLPLGSKLLAASYTDGPYQREIAELLHLHEGGHCQNVADLASLGISKDPLRGEPKNFPRLRDWLTEGIAEARSILFFLRETYRDGNRERIDKSRAAVEKVGQLRKEAGAEGYAAAYQMDLELLKAPSDWVKNLTDSEIHSTAIKYCAEVVRKMDER